LHEFLDVATIMYWPVTSLSEQTVAVQPSRLH